MCRQHLPVGVVAVAAVVAAVAVAAIRTRTTRTVRSCKYLSYREVERRCWMPAFLLRGLCDGAPCIKVYVARKTPELLGQIPATIAGHPVAVEETGEFKALRR